MYIEMSFRHVYGMMQDAFQGTGNVGQRIATKQKDREAQIRMLEAIGYFLEMPPAREATVMNWLDMLFVELMRNNQLPFMQGQTLRILSERLRVTEYNRKRIRKVLPLIRPLMDRELHPWVQENLSLFFSVWYFVPPDSLLEKFPQPDLLDGYSRRRYLALSSRNQGQNVSSGTLGQTIAYDFQGYGNGDAFIRMREQLHKGDIEEYLSIAYDLTFDPARRRAWQQTKGSGTRFTKALKEAAIDKAFHFDMKTPHRTFHLTNLSADRKHSFVLQIDPPWYWKVVPGFGTLGPKQTMPLTVTFNHSPLDTPSTIGGFLRVRSLQGFPLERLSLLGRTGPLLRLLTPSLDFGVCSVGVKRVMRAYVLNCGSSPSPCRFFDHSSVAGKGFHRRKSVAIATSPFQVIPDLIFLRPGEIKSVDVMFTPNDDGVLCVETLTLLGVANERYSLTMKGRGGTALQVSEKMLNFGTTVLGVAVDAVLTLTNVSASKSLPVSFKCNSPCISVEDIVLEPSGTKACHLVFTPKASGAWSEQIEINTPSGGSLVVPMKAHVGPLLDIRCNKYISFPPIPINTYHHLSFLISNLADCSVEFSLTGLEQLSFVVAFEGEDENHTTSLTKSSLSAQKLREDRPSLIKLPPYAATTMHIWFASHHVGLYHTTFDIKLLYPHVQYYGPFVLKASCLNQITNLVSAADKAVHANGASMLLTVQRRFVTRMGHIMVNRELLINTNTEEFKKKLPNFSFNTAVAGSLHRTPR